MITSLLSTPLDSPLAFPVAGGLGAAIGGGMGLAFQGIANLPVDLLVGGLLGAGWCGVQRAVATTTTRIHEYRAIADYPAVRAILRKAGTDEHDMAALHCLTEKLETSFGTMISRFNEYCDQRGLAPCALIGDVIRHFYLTHCADRGVVLLSKHSLQACYLVAAHQSDQGRISAALNAPNISAGTALRQLRCPYVRVDLVNEQLAHARSFTTEERNGEWKVRAVNARPGDTLETVQPSSLVDAVRRRCRRRTGGEGTASLQPVPDTVTCSTPSNISRSATLRMKLSNLPADSRTWQELDRIEQDLAAHRSCGHPVTYQGTHYLAIDIHWEGRRSPGRNAWRLLYFRTAAGYELSDIVDYHRPRS